MTATELVAAAGPVQATLALPGLDEPNAASSSSLDAREYAARRVEIERRARARARRRTREHRRARRRVAAGGFAAHPGWRRRRVRFRARHDQRGRVLRGADPVIAAAPEGQVVIADQAWAMARIQQQLDAETLWRADRRRTAAVVLQAVAHGMDWTTGLVAGLTRSQLAAGAGCSTRTVSRVLAWAATPEVGLLVCVEPGASAAHLGTEVNRAAAYAFVADGGDSPGADRRSSPAGVVDEDGNPPASSDSRSTPRADQGKKRLDKHPEQASWGLWDRPRTATERAAATHRLLERIGMSGQVARYRVVGLLSRWWSDPRVCVAGLLHALDHHPDQPERGRGDALRGARDPLAVLAARLAPWQGRLHELPDRLLAVDPDERRQRAAEAHRADPDLVPRGHTPTASSAVRAAARRAAAPRPGRRIRP